MGENRPNIIAFYLPQFYPFKENNEWWGKGFTEWTNVAKAKPLFKGHNQPRIPADLSFYDLRVAQVREEQAQLAAKAGVTAFCYWHYWFGNGKRLLSQVFDEVLESGKPDFPFCLGWANHSWFAKTWNKDTKDKLLIEQTYPGIDDAREHFSFLLKAFKDERYVKIDGKPFLFIFDPKALPASYIEHFDIWAKEAGFPGLYLVANLKPFEQKEEFLSNGYSAVLINRIIQYSKLDSKIDQQKSRIVQLRYKYKSIDLLLKFRRWCIDSLSKQKPTIVDYESFYPQLVTQEEYSERVIPQLVPQWDHTPRSGMYGLAWINATPNHFYNHAKQVLQAVKEKQNKVIILKSWNEWGEGNYMEPDTTYGHGFIEALSKALSEE